MSYLEHAVEQAQEAGELDPRLERAGDRVPARRVRAVGERALPALPRRARVRGGAARDPRPDRKPPRGPRRLTSRRLTTPWLARLGAPRRSRLHAPLDGREPRPGRRLETIAAAADAGITVFDTAHSYGLGADELGHNEALLARALRAAGATERARIVTKGGMTRAGGAWVPDGRAKAIRADCEASLAALDGLPIDLYLIHAPDPRTPWRTSVRALAASRRRRPRRPRRARERQPAAAGRGARARARSRAVQVAISPFDDRALRGGVVERCAEAGIAVIAHSPLGGPRRAGRPRAERDARRGSRTHTARLRPRSRSRGCSISPERRRDSRRAPPGDRAAPPRAQRRSTSTTPSARLLARELGEARPAPRKRTRRDDADVVIVMGIPGAGKSRVAEEYVARGYRRLNRDERGGSLRALAGELDELLASGVTRVVLDNTYLTRAARSHVARRGEPPRCWRPVRLARHAARPGAGQPRRAAARSLRLAADAREAPPARAFRAGRARADVADALGPRAGAAVDRRGICRRRAGAVRARRRRRRERESVCLVAAAALRRLRLAASSGSRRSGSAAPRLRLEPGRDLTRLLQTSRVSRPMSPDRWRARCARTRPARRAAGAGRRCLGCRSRSRGSTTSIRARSILVGAGPAHRTLATTLGARYVAA